MTKARHLVCALVLAGGCDSHTNKNNGPDDLSAADLSVSITGDAGDDLAVEVGDLAIGCHQLGESCSGNGDCCSGTLCDTSAKVCIKPIVCGNLGDPCTSPSECCGLTCTASKCGACTFDFLACTQDAECCSGQCVNNACKPLATACRTSGNPCTVVDGGTGTDAGSGNCCSGLCKDGICSLQASYCTQVGDVCFSNADCCTGLCSKSSATALTGICGDLKLSVSCTIDGLKCNGCGDCCSRLCAPYGSSGVRICQPASGCHVYGDLCRKNSDCCGGELPDSGLPGAGLVQCSLIAGAGGLGYCDHPKASNGDTNTCNPEGDVCHFQNYACSGSSTRNNCCACVASKECCVLDSLGIPRCNAINPADGGTCVALGGNCTFSSECCGGVPCVPNASGQLVCGYGTDGGSCVPAGGPCTTTADCCSGITCIIPTGSLQGTCTNLTPPSADMSAPQSVCSEIGQSCDTNPCCNGLDCRNDQGPCGTTGAGCFCLSPVG
jgi:hypothetical protein